MHTLFWPEQKLSQSFFLFKEPFQYGHPVNTARFLWPIGDWISRVPLLFPHWILSNIIINYMYLGSTGIVQWWECSPPTNVSQVWFPDLASYVGWVCCWFSTLFFCFFFCGEVLWFSPLLENQYFQIPIIIIWSWNARAFLILLNISK